MNNNIRRSSKLRSGATLQHRSGFTLVEILVTVSIIIVLAGMSIGLISRMRRSGLVVKELAAARNLTSALTLASQDLSGAVPWGNDMTIPSISIEDSGYKGNSLHGEAAHRWTWRLAPYFGYKFEGTTVVSSDLKFLLDKNSVSNSYMISLVTSLGMNVYGVGGEREDILSGASPGCIRMMNEAVSPNTLIAFISSRVENRESPGEILAGNFKVTTPLSPGGDWAIKYDSNKPSSWGGVDLRHDNKAVVGYLDGSAGTLDRTKAKDMRLWNNEAARLNDPNHRPSSSSGGGRDR